MGITTTQYVKKPLYVNAARITRQNFSEVVTWCDGKVQTERADHPENPGKKYIKLQTHNPINTRQTKAFVGDWILQTDRGFKVYTHKAFLESFDERPKRTNGSKKSYPHQDGDFTVIGPQCFASKDETVLNWKGVNYVPQGGDRSVEAEAQAFAEAEEEDLDSCGSPRTRLADPSVPH